MKVRLLGTGAADGWPNPWCDCGSCRDHADRGLLRSPTSVLIDDRLLLDPGPEAPRQSLRAGDNLTGVSAVLVSHAHHDHLDPAFLLYRGWLGPRPLQVWGPEPVLEQCRAWLDPEQDQVTLHRLGAGDRVEIAGYLVDALPARHHAFGEALVYRISDGRASLLYASDTGPLPSRSVETLTGSTLDAVLLEETFGDFAGGGSDHHTLTDFAATLTRLRRIGAVSGSTMVVAVHLSHHNPPLEELSRRLAEVGATCLPDGSLLLLSED